jgi:hypothetical protein
MNCDGGRRDLCSSSLCATANTFEQLLLWAHLQLVDEVLVPELNLRA